jgi:hypothetical protein
MKTILSMAAALALWVSAAAAQDEEAAAERCAALPAPVEKMREDIRAAAAARDYAALAKLTDPAEFTYSFGEEGGDPVQYWKSVEAEGTDIPATIVALLDMGCAVLTYEEMTEYVWPTAAEVPYAELTETEKAALEKLYPGKVEEQYIEGPEVGYYAAWRLYIGEDGHWTSFVAGD